MSLPALMTAFEQSARKADGGAPDAEVSFIYDDPWRLSKAIAFLSHAVDVYQRGINPLRDSALSGVDGEVKFSVQFAEEDAEKARALWNRLYDGNRKAFNSTFGQDCFSFYAFSEAVHLEHLAKLTEEAGFVPRVSYGHTEFAADPLLVGKQKDSVTLRYRREYDGQEEGITLRRILRDMEEAGLLPDSLAISGMDGYIDHRFTLTVTDVDKALEALREPALPIGFDVNADYFVTNVDREKKQISLVGPEGAQYQFRENTFAEGGLLVKLETARIASAAEVAAALKEAAEGLKAAAGAAPARLNLNDAEESYLNSVRKRIRPRPAPA